MKKKVILILAICLYSTIYGFNIKKNTSDFSPEEKEAISILKENYLFMYFWKPSDETKCIDTFLDHIHNIVSMDNKKRAHLDSSIRYLLKDNSSKRMRLNDVLGLLPMIKDEFIPLMGLNVYSVIKKKFTTLETNKIFHKVSEDRKSATKAYYFLSGNYKEIYLKKGIIHTTYGNPKELLDRVFNYYHISY